MMHSDAIAEIANASKEEWQAFTDWQDSYRVDFHGQVPWDESLDWGHFKAGGLRDHLAPVCEHCPIKKHEWWEYHNPYA